MREDYDQEEYHEIDRYQPSYEELLAAQKVTVQDVLNHITGPVVSVIAHVILLALLGTIVVFRAPEERKDIAVEVTEVDITELEKIPEPPEPPEEVEYATATKFRLLEAYGIEAPAGVTKVYLSDTEVNRFSNYAAGLTIAISPTSRRPARRWKKEYFAELADALIRKHKVRIVFVWGPGEDNYVREIAAMMKEEAEITLPTKLTELAAMLKNCALLVGNCNGVRHLAVAVGTPTLAIHGPTHWKAWKPPNGKHEVIYSDVECIFCGRRECKSMICMKNLKPSAVEKKVSEMLHSEERC